MLVGGEGTRLRPLTFSRHKSLVPVLGRPLLHHVLAHLSRHGFDEIVLAVSHRRDDVIAAIGDGAALGVRVAYADEPEPLGSAGAIRNVAALLEGRTFLVVNGDILTGIDLTAMLAHHRRHKALVTIALTPVDDPISYGVVALDEQDRILRFVEKAAPGTAPSSWANAGFWLFEPAALDRIPAGRSMVETGLFPDLAAAGEQFIGYRSHAHWIDAGTPERYLRANLDALHGASVSGEGVLVHPTAHISAVCLGDGCEVGEGAEVAESVLWERVRVGRDARVRSSVLADGVTIGEGAELEGAVLGRGVAIGPGAHPAPGLSLNPGERYPAAEAAGEAV